MSRITLVASCVLLIGLSSAAHAEGNDYYMLIGDSWELGKVIANSDGTEEFVTCPGEQRYKIDKDNLKATTDPCDGGSERFAVIEGWDKTQNQFIARMGNGELKTWTPNNPAQLQGLGAGTEVYLAPTMPNGDVTDVFRVIKPSL